jgi:DNA-binding NtrC family response regulator
MPLPRNPKMKSKWSILIVDDEFAVRESFRMLLKSSYEIYTAPDGEEALNIIRERKIDLITLDLNMPKLSGIETLREIRKIDGEVPVIIITGYGTQKDEEEALLYGVRDFIPKPFNISKITSVIDGILEERVK